MSHLQTLRDAETRKDVASILDSTPSKLAYILFRGPDALKYTSFEIPKRSGEVRQIKAPAPRLRRLQRRLASVLYLCLDEIETSGGGRRSLAHGFERKRSIVTNASLHKRRRYVLNLDLEDFFPSFNFGRVRGFFIKDKNFGLNEDVATLIAQIACHENQLPQGSPCSPVISNLIGHLLDVRLAQFAKKHKCTYSRYVDDITFSTSRKDFPPELAVPVSETSSRWQLGAPIVSKIEGSGFRINEKKTRMQCRGSRQVTTGLLVNEKVNIRPEYYKMARAMCNELFSTGSYYRMVPANVAAGQQSTTKTRIEEPRALEGILGHIQYVKHHTVVQQNADNRKSSSSWKLYKKFLIYKNFVALQQPLIVPEGKTDEIYLKEAIKNLANYHPQLGQMSKDKFFFNVRFMKYTRTVHEFLSLGNGSGAFADLIYEYNRTVKQFRNKPMAHPVIFLIDNDDGAKDLFKALKAFKISHVSTEGFYLLWWNLYLVKTPEIGANSKSCIEDLFIHKVLQTVWGGKIFELNKKNTAKGTYSKMIFAEKVIKPTASTIDFSNFALLLDRIVAVLRDYEQRRPALGTA